MRGALGIKLLCGCERVPAERSAPAADAGATRAKSDEGGGFAEAWVPVATLSAALQPTGGGEGVESDRLAGTITHDVVLRYRPGVVPAMRFRKGTRIFRILAVFDVEERRRCLKCLCEERDL